MYYVDLNKFRIRTFHAAQSRAQTGRRAHRWIRTDNQVYTSERAGQIGDIDLACNDVIRDLAAAFPLYPCYVCVREPDPEIVFVCELYNVAWFIAEVYIKNIHTDT